MRRENFFLLSIGTLRLPAQERINRFHWNGRAKTLLVLTGCSMINTGRNEVDLSAGILAEIQSSAGLERSGNPIISGMDKKK